jgi:hypothetical protein
MVVAIILTLLAGGTEAYRFFPTKSNASKLGLAARGSEVISAASKQLAIESMEEFSESTIGEMVAALLSGDGPRSSDVIRAGTSKMSLEGALRRVESKLPGAIVALARETGEDASELSEAAKVAEVFDEASLEKARKILNGMMEQSQVELDAKMIECKEFEARNRGTFEQVTTDISRLGSQMADLDRLRSEANNGISAKSDEMDDSEALLRDETSQYQRIKLEDEAEMTVRQNDLAVVTFILEVTKCPTALLQDMREAEAPARVCRTENGLELSLDNSKLQDKFEKMMTPNAKAMFEKSLSQMLGKSYGADLLEVNNLQPPAGKSADPPMLKEAAPVKDGPAPGNWKKCTNAKPNCGLLHDTMSVQWGKMKDVVDELQMEMDKKDSDFEELKKNINDQLNTLGNAKAVFNQMLGEAISSINADTAETAQKEGQKRELTKEYEAVMKSCKAKIEEILFTNICAVRVVRNTVMKHSKVSPPERIDDCDVGDFIPGPCSVPCDDTCPQDDPYACGGFTTLTREVVVSPNEFGTKCPVLEMQAKCNQVKCPINCKMSRWSSWSKCTKDCEGGVQGRTRSILTKPANGGESCEPVQENRPCNTGSCDRDCTLKPWTAWEPCSMACSGGLQARVRKVLIPIRGMGKCPSKSSSKRIQEQVCNTQDCVGDEVCVAKQDLVIAVDSSGSLREKGSNAVRDFAAKYIEKLKGKYYGDSAMQVGVLQYGNGALEADGTVAKAIEIQKLTHDMAEAQKAASGLQWQRGFTNMAQALILASKMLQQGGRPTAQSAIMVLTDGKPSFLFQTQMEVNALRDQNIKLFFVPVMESRGKEFEQMKKWATAPWETHLLHIPGVAPLEADPDIFVGKAVATFCPRAVSPSGAAEFDKTNGFFLLKSGGHCGKRGDELGVEVFVAKECKVLAQEAGYKAFSFGKGELRRGYCYGEELPVTDKDMGIWKSNRADPPCPTGEWQAEEFFDFYVLEPPESFE